MSARQWGLDGHFAYNGCLMKQRSSSCGSMFYKDLARSFQEMLHLKKPLMPLLGKLDMD